MTAPPAARQGDAISHTESGFGFGLGGAIGLAAGLALLTVATGGADLAVLAAVGGAVAMTGGGALAGMKIGATYGHATGDIVTGSLNVHVNGQNAARTLADVAVCDEHDAPQKIATGSNSVFINGMPAARLGDVTICDARITSASPNVFIGGGTTSYANISPEVPQLAVDVAASMVIAGSAVALGAGGFAAYASAGWAGVGVFGLQSAGGIAGSVALGQVGKEAGGALGGERGAAWGEVGLGLAGGAAGGLTGDALAGTTGLKYGANQNVAQSFYAEQGWPQSRIDSHMSGIDFNQPVSVVTLPQDSQLSQWQVPGGSQGNYFAPASETPDRLGISPMGSDPAGNVVPKGQIDYTSTEPTRALSSQAASVNDTWSTPGTPYQTSGGGQQYFVPNKGAFTPAPGGSP